MRLLVNLDVDDLERAVDFYRRGLGLRVARRLFAGTVVEMRGASGPIYLLSRPVGRFACGRASLRRHYRRHWTPVHLDFVVKDVAAAVRRARAAGAKLEIDVQGSAWGRIANLSDPFGHGFCLLSFSRRGYDAVVARDRPSGWSIRPDRPSPRSWNARAVAPRAIPGHGSRWARRQNSPRQVIVV